MIDSLTYTLLTWSESEEFEEPEALAVTDHQSSVVRQQVAPDRAAATPGEKPFRGDVDALAWPLSRLGEALETLALRSGLSPRETHDPLVPPESLARQGMESLGRWIESTASCLGFEAEPAEVPYAEVATHLRQASPALLCLPGNTPRFLSIQRGGRRTVSLLGPDHRRHTVDVQLVVSALCEELEGPVRQEIDGILEEAGVAVKHRARARQAILRDRLGAVSIRGCWLLRLAPGASFARQLWHAHLPGHLMTLVGAHLTQYFLWLLSWWMLGLGALEGRLDTGWLISWALVLLTLVPFRLLATWSQGRVAIGIAGLLKQRLLHGALRLEAEEIRHQGSGELLARVMETEAVESLAVSGGLAAGIASLELMVATAVLFAGAGASIHPLLLAGWLALGISLAMRYFWRRRRWTETRLAMTNDIVERIVGHRTRLAQEPRSRWHDADDQSLERYLEHSIRMDRSASLLWSLLPRGWLVLGLVGLAPAFISGAGTNSLAISLGGILLSYQALEKLATGVTHIVGAAIAWKQVRTLFEAASRPETLGAPAFAIAPGRVAATAEQPLLEAEEIVFRHRPQSEPVLRGCALRIRAGDRLILEGPSGGGKSTLSSILVGMRRPESGLLLLHGLDRETLGSEGWRRRVVAAPQFHENHVLTETLAFNLLMGHRWPPEAEDLREAAAVCRELGLGDLLDRMPAGLFQMVGESGWQLSHGEKSRLFIARCVLQGAELVILDESLAALDPETLNQTLTCLLKRAPTLMVIAHA